MKQRSLLSLLIALLTSVCPIKGFSLSLTLKNTLLHLGLTIILLSPITLAKAQKQEALKDKFYFFKVWGFLKYNHPALATGAIDADSLFIDGLLAIDDAKSQQHKDDVLLRLLQSLQTASNAEGVNAKPVNTDLLKNVDHTWFNGDKFLSAAVRSQLKQVFVRRYTGDHHHYYMTRHFDVNLPNEKAYNFADSASLPYAYRMLSLAKIQATVDYLFPHKYLMDKDWNGVIQQAIPKFIQAESRRDYEKELLLLTANLNDTHSNGFYRNLKSAKSILKVRYYPPFDYSLVNDGKQILVTKIIVPALCAAADIRSGDLITRINDLTVQERVLELSRYLPASNANALAHQLNNYLENLLYITESLHADLTYKRAGKTTQTKIEWVSKPEDVKTLTSYVRQLNTPKVQGKDLEFIAADVVVFRANETTRFLNGFADDQLTAGMDSLFTQAGKQKGMVFDLRSYPDWGGFPFMLYNRFGQDTIPFAQYYALNKQQIGTFRLLTNNVEYYPQTAKPGMHVYNGKVVVLVNGSTRSAAEHNAMFLQHMFPQLITIGSQSAGADGDVVSLTLPGGNKLEFTGNAIFYPDGTEVQRRGVKIDKFIKPTIDDLVGNEDTLLKEALRMINQP